MLLVVAHPDDEYAFAATAYRIGKELGGTVDQVIIADGAGGYRYSSLAERVLRCFADCAGRTRIAAADSAGVRHWRRAGYWGSGSIIFWIRRIPGSRSTPTRRSKSSGTRLPLPISFPNLLRRGKYEYVFTLLPTGDTHGHHRAATYLAWRAAERQPEETRPVLFGAEPGTATTPAPSFAGDPLFHDVRNLPDTPVFAFEPASHVRIQSGAELSDCRELDDR